MAITSKQKTGKWGENQARIFLEKKGYEILECNWRFRKAEIDLIAKFGSTLVFVEVKTRKNSDFGNPEAFVSNLQVSLIKSACEEYQIQKDFTGFIRFDIVSITGRPDNFEILHLEDAF